MEGLELTVFSLFGHLGHVQCYIPLTTPPMTIIFSLSLHAQYTTSQNYFHDF